MGAATNPAIADDFKPIVQCVSDVGDAINAGGVAGVVKSMNLVSTVIYTFDNQRVIVPNNSIWGGIITNFTGENTRRVDMVFGIGYGDDLKKAKQLLRDIVDADERILKDPDDEDETYSILIDPGSSSDFSVVRAKGMGRWCLLRRATPWCLLGRKPEPHSRL